MLPSFANCFEGMFTSCSQPARAFDSEQEAGSVESVDKQNASGGLSNLWLERVARYATIHEHFALLPIGREKR